MDGEKHGGDSPQPQRSGGLSAEVERGEHFEVQGSGGQRPLGEKECALTDKEQEVRVAGGQQ